MRNLKIVQLAAWCFFISVSLPTSELSADEPLPIQEGQRLALVGNSLAERMNLYGHLETRLQARFQDRKLYFRNFGRPAEEVSIQQRPSKYTLIDDPLEVFGPDLFFCCFGFNESFAGTSEEAITKFKQDYQQYIDNLGKKYGRPDNPAEFVLLGPVSMEASTSRHQTDCSLENRRLSQYSAAIREVAAAAGFRYVDLFEATNKVFGATSGLQYTVNGVHLNEAGDRLVAKLIEQQLFGNAVEPEDDAAYEKLRAAVIDKSWYHQQDYRMLNGWYVYGGRRTWDTKTFPSEFKKIRNMVAVRDQYVWDIAAGREVPDQPDDSNTGEIVIPQTMFGTRDEAFRENREPEELRFPTPAEQIEMMTVPDGMKVQLFASEKEFPELANPTQIDFDNQGRLWVSCMSNYPQWQPDLDKPNDRLLIFKDNDSDGVADECITFYDKLHCPTGFEFWNGGVLVVDQPRIVFLKDTDGDDRADEIVHLFDGFGTDDTHHSIGAWEYSHGGFLHMLEGIQVSSAVETPQGPLRNYGPSGAYVVDPLSFSVRYFRTPGYGNPWCLVFNMWGNGVIGDGTSSRQHWHSPWSGAPVNSRSTMRAVFDNEGMRPSVGSEFLNSRQMPEEMRNHFIYGCVINMHGLTTFDVRDEQDGAGLTGERVQDLLVSSDKMFRPIDPHIGPDGTVWFGDWCNPLIGHMQYSQRDPNRDHAHGRIYRLVNTNKPLLEPLTQKGKSVEELLGQLKVYETRMRYRVRRELRDRPEEEVIPAVERWVQDLTDPLLMCEAMWVLEGFRTANIGLLERILASDNFRARAAAIHTVSNLRDNLPLADRLLEAAIHDEHPRVRVEALRGLSFVGTAEAAETALEVTEQRMDYWIEYTLEQTLNALKSQVRAAEQKGTFLANASSKARDYFEELQIKSDPGRLAKKFIDVALDETLEEEERLGAVDEFVGMGNGNSRNGKKVFNRVCSSCHQVAGKGKIFGPDLTHVSSRMKATDIVWSIIEPNAEIAKGYETLTVEDDNGKVYNGFLVAETDEILTLRVEGGELKEFVIDDLEMREEKKASSMPEALPKTFSAGEFLDLMSYIRGLREKGWIPAAEPDRQPEEYAGMREVSHDADLQIDNDFPGGWNRTADYFVGGKPREGGQYGFDFRIHSKDPDDQPYVVIRLKQPELITHIWIANRVKGFHERAKSLAVWLSEDGKDWNMIWKAEKGEAEYRIDVDPEQPLRYVKIGLRENGTLNLFRAAVFAK